MISIKELSFSYGKKEVLQGLDLQLMQGNIYGLLGRNGAGKTTLLKLISGELFHRTGELRVQGRIPGERTPPFLADLFYIPEEFSLPAMSMKQYENIISPFYKNFSPEKFRKYLKEFELSDSEENLTKMSYGQKKKFLLAFALAAGTSLLLLDEPTNGLDIPSKTQFRRTVASALGENQIILISTHQVRDMENLIDPLIIIDEGSLRLNASLEEISRQYIMENIPRGELPEDVLYAEDIPGGQTLIRKRRDGESESAMDLEILFNFIVRLGGIHS